MDRDVADGDFVLVGSEGRQDFALLALRNLHMAEGPSEFGCDLIEFCRRDPQVPVSFLKPERRRPRVRSCDGNMFTTA
jgi:hypothetical protein